jgi:ATP-binding cassette subfamily C (CFTR/MRP) protein 1
MGNDCCFGNTVRLVSRQKSSHLKTDSVLLAAPLSIADQILVLGKDGTAAEAGSFTELIKSGGYISSIAKLEERIVDDHQDEVSRAEDEPDHSQSTPELNKSTVPTDKRRQLGDNTVYRFYFSSLGIVFTVIFLAIEFFNAFLSTFPSERVLDIPINS